MLKKKNIIMLIAIFVILIIFLIIFIQSHYKKTNNGNNINNKTLDECEEYIYNISSYEAIAKIEVKSNKNSNKYIIRQINSKQEKIQEILEPENIKGIKFIYIDNTLSIENAKLDLKKIYEDYPYIEENSMFLTDFISEYKNNKQNGNTALEKQNDYIVYTINLDGVYINKKELYIDVKTGNPIKLIVQDNNKRNIIYILYNEIKLNI